MMGRKPWMKTKLRMPYYVAIMLDVRKLWQKILFLEFNNYLLRQEKKVALPIFRIFALFSNQDCETWV